MMGGRSQASQKKREKQREGGREGGREGEREKEQGSEKINIILCTAYFAFFTIHFLVFNQLHDWAIKAILFKRLLVIIENISIFSYLLIFIRIAFILSCTGQKRKLEPT